MGTKGFYGFILHGNIKIVQCNNDAYPEWLGDGILNYARLNAYMNKLYELSKRVEKLELKEEDFDYESISPTQVISDIEKGLRVSIPSAFLFAQNSSDCEYGYIINLDKKTLDLYRGFQRNPQIGNPFGVIPTEDGYYPCKHIASLDFITSTFQDMIDAFEKEKKCIENSYSFINA